MATTNRNVLAVILWVIGILGGTGYINPFGFFALLVPLLFIVFADRFTRTHAREYFNILLTSAVVYVLGIVVNWFIDLFGGRGFDFTFIALFYFLIMSIIGLLQALSNKRFRAPLTVRVFQ